jgi:hypothetical protein
VNQIIREIETDELRTGPGLPAIGFFVRRRWHVERGQRLARVSGRP